MTPEQSYALIGLGTGLLQNATSSDPYTRPRISTGLGAGIPMALQGIQLAQQQAAQRQQAAQQDLMRQATMYYLIRQAQGQQAANQGQVPMQLPAQGQAPVSPGGRGQVQLPQNAMPADLSQLPLAMTAPNQDSLAPKGASAPPMVGDLLSRLRPEQVAAFLAAAGGDPSQSLPYIAPKQYGSTVNVRDPITGQVKTVQLSEYGTGQPLGQAFAPHMVDLGGEKRFLDYAQVPNNTSFGVSINPNDQLKSDTALQVARMRLAATQAAAAQPKPADITPIRMTDPETGLPVTRFVNKQVLAQTGDINKATITQLTGAPKALPTPVLEKTKQAAAFGPQLATFLQNRSDYEMPVIGGGIARAAATTGDRKAADALAAFNAMRVAGQSQIPGIPSNRDVEQFIASLPSLSKSTEQNNAAALQSYKAQREQLELARDAYRKAGYDTTPIEAALQSFDSSISPILSGILPKAKDGAYIVSDETEAQLVPSGAPFVIQGTNIRKVKP